MKRIFTILFWLFVASNVSAQQYAVVDGIRYGYADDTAFVANGNYESDIVIPSQVTIENNNYSVTAIGDSAFYGSLITSIIIPESVTYIGRASFAACIKLSTVNIPKVAFIGDNAFESSSIVSISLPETVSYIGSNAFSHTMLEKIIIPSNLTSICDSTFYYCSHLKSVEIPDNVISIGRYAFSFCDSLTFITIPKNVRTIGDYCFASSGQPTITITMSVGLTSIGVSAFAGSNLTYISIPESVTIIEDSAFYNCWQVTYITIPSNVTFIGKDAFYGTEYFLSKIICYAKTPPDVVGWKDYSIPLYVPCENLIDYQNHEIWGQFTQIKCVESLDIPNIMINDGDTLPTIVLSDYFILTKPLEYYVYSSNNRIVYPVIMDDILSFIQYGTGTAKIDVSASLRDTTIKKSFNVTISPTQPEIPCNLSISSDITNATCNTVADGKIELSVSGGTEPYYYKWNTERTSSGIYNVAAGTYSVLVMDDNGCTAEEKIIVNEPSAIVITESITPSTCGGSDGNIEVSVTGGTEPYSFAWKNTSVTTNVFENLSVGSYEVTVTDGNSCKTTKTISVSDEGAAILTLKTVNSSKCNEATGSVEVSVSGGTGQLTYEWSDSTVVSNNLIRPKLFAGDYSLSVVDENNCQSVLSVNVPLTSVRQPEIALVSYGDTARHNLVVWQKEQTDDIDEYHIYRETEQSGVYEQIGSSAYNEASIYVDSTADFNSQAFRYRLSAANSCGETPLSREYKTIQLRWKKNDNGSVQLWWDSYEGLAFVKYDLYKLTRSGLEKIKELPANKFRYTVDVVEPGTFGYFVAVELIDTIDVNQYLKAEGGPFVIAFSNIAEIESRDVVDEVIENLPLVFSKNKTIFISNAGENNIFVCDMIGKIIAQRQKVNSAEIPVKLAGVYVVIVGDKVFKVVVE